jgi:hypothetical protein
MILSAEEYSRGFIDFDAELPEGCTVNIWTSTTDNPSENKGEWNGPYYLPSGCKVGSAPKPYIGLRVELKRGDNPSKAPILKQVRWERDNRTFIWPGVQGFSGPPGALVLGRDYGSSYRIVLKPKKAFWTEPIILIENTVRVRFSKGKLRGLDISGFQDETSNPDGATSIIGTIEDKEVEGDLIEILATVPTDDESYGEETAKTQVESITGLLSLCFGEQILGQKVFEDYYFSKPSNEQGEVHVPVKQLPIQSVNFDSAIVVDKSLLKLEDSSLSVAISLALRWYAKGLMYESPVDQFIAYFIGLDALASGYFSTANPRPVREECIKFQKYLEKAQPKMSKELESIILERLKDFPLTQKFSYYWSSHFNGETQLGGKFSKLNRHRGELLHGKAQSVTLDEINDAKTMLEKLLSRELGIENLLKSRQEGPKILGAKIGYLVKPRIK